MLNRRTVLQNGTRGVCTGLIYRAWLPGVLSGSLWSTRVKSVEAGQEAEPAKGLWLDFPIGVKGTGGQILARVVHAAFDDPLAHQDNRVRVLLVGPDTAECKTALRGVVAEWAQAAEQLPRQAPHQRINLSVLWLSPKWLTDEATFPPPGTYYSDPEQQEAQYAWRWLAQLGPDLVIVLRHGTQGRALVPSNDLNRRSLQITAPTEKQKGGLAGAVTQTEGLETGPIPAIVLESAAGEVRGELERMASRLMVNQFSPARRELQRRRARSATALVQELSQTYGTKLDSVVYIPAVALMARVRLGTLQGENTALADVERIVSPYVSGQKPTLPEKPSASHLSGHLIFADLALATKNPRYTELVLNAADLGFNERGEPKQAMPHHSEMSDAVFMGGPILAAAGALTQNEKYFDMLDRQLRFMWKLCRREDGIYRHSPLDDAAWGRGNGFPALGLALCLEYLPEEAAVRADVLQALKDHLQALVPYQHPTGMWHQVIDHPETYREFSSTCMITFAMAQGIRRGWLDRENYAPVIARSWPAIRQRVGPQGSIVDICTGTGKQQSLQDYFHRTAILGKDERGGAMGMLIAAEMAHHTG
jgi:unsaturated rhamnogalacturonyl hydrolase